MRGGVAGPVFGVALVFCLLAAPTVLAATAQYPNLKTLAPRDLRVERTDVSVDGSGHLHNVLRFSNTVWNAGEGRVEMRGQIDPATKSGAAVQRVYDDAGGFSSYGVGTFTYHDVHSHYHYDAWGSYQLWTKAAYDAWIANGRSAGQAKRVGVKTTSCVMDEEFIRTLAGSVFPAAYPSSGCYPNAQNLMVQGISVGWGDTYDYWRFEQWIDLDQETLADGQYVLRSVTDPKNKIYESAGKATTSRESEQDNEAITVFTVQGGRPVDSNPPSGTVAINDISARTSSPSVSVKLLGRDDVSGVNQVRLSNNNSQWATYPFRPNGSTPNSIGWDLTNATDGGNSSDGTKIVYAQFRDAAGKWSSSVTDTIVLDRGTDTMVPDRGGATRPSPSTASGGLFPAPIDTIAPQIVRFALTRRRFEVGQPRAGSRRGATFRYIVSEPGRVTFRIQRALAGRRSRGRCRRPTLRLLQARRCTRYVTVGSFTRTIRRLSNRTAFSGRLRGKALRPGRYRTVAAARDGAGNRSRHRKARFVIAGRWTWSRSDRGSLYQP